jgi:hypothetical protein
MAIFIHLASVWVPFTSEAKEAVAHYPELLREITLALQECGRKLAQSLRARARLDSEGKRKSLFERYIPELGYSLAKITRGNQVEIEQTFYRALPNFVKLGEIAQPDDEGPGGGSGGDGAPPDAGSPSADDDVPVVAAKKSAAAPADNGKKKSSPRPAPASKAVAPKPLLASKSVASKSVAPKSVAPKSVTPKSVAPKPPSKAKKKSEQLSLLK